MIPSDRLAKDVGKHFKQTSIELTKRHWQSRHASSVQTEISRFFITDTGRTTDIGKKDLG